MAHNKKMRLSFVVAIPSVWLNVCVLSNKDAKEPVLIISMTLQYVVLLERHRLEVAHCLGTTYIIVPPNPRHHIRTSHSHVYIQTEQWWCRNELAALFFLFSQSVRRPFFYSRSSQKFRGLESFAKGLT